MNSKHLAQFTMCLIFISCGPTGPITNYSSSSSTITFESESLGYSTSQSPISQDSNSSSDSNSNTETSESTGICGPGAPSCEQKEKWQSCRSNDECKDGLCIVDVTGASFCTEFCNSTKGCHMDGICFHDMFCVLPCEMDNDCFSKFCGELENIKICKSF